MRRVAPPLQRREVLWLGQRPDEAVQREFAQRNLIFQPCDQKEVAKHLALATGMVLRFDSTQQAAFKSHLVSLAPSAADHGLLLVALADDDRSYQQMEKVFKRSPLRAAFIRRAAPPDYEIPERIARHDPGPGAADVEIRGEEVPALTQLFLKRAFFDCRFITIAGLKGGRSANVFSVYAVFRDSLVGPRPLPFFAKVDVLK